MSETNTISIPPEADVEDRKIYFSKIRIIKNLVVVSLGSLFILGADDMVLTFHSTMNREKSVGVASVVIQYAFSFISSFFLPKYLVLKYGSKAIMILSIILFMPFLVTNYYPLYYLMLLTSMLLGVGFSLLWESLDPYINNLSSLYVDHQLTDMLEKNKSATKEKIASNERYKSLEPVFMTSTFTGASYNLGNDIGIEAKTGNGYNPSHQSDISTKLDKETSTANISNMDVIFKQEDDDLNNRAIRPDVNSNNKTIILESTTVRFFGFHSMIYQTCYVLSNISSFFVLQRGYSPDHYSISDNETCSCGAAYCNVETPCSEHNLQQPSLEARNILISICVGLCVLAGVVVIAFMDDLKRKDRSVSFSLDMLLATFRQIKKKEHLLLMLLTVNVGLMKGFYVGDFTKSYIGCAWGIQYLGLVTACAGVTMAFFSTVSGWFTKHIGRLPIFLMAAILNTVLNVILIIWQPNPNTPVMFFVTAGLWGGLFGTFNTQGRAFYGVLFKKDEEAAFGAYQLWYCVGSCLCLSYSDYVCNDIKIYIMIAVSTLGIIGYLIVERSHSLTNNRNLPSTSDKYLRTDTDEIGVHRVCVGHSPCRAGDRAIGGVPSNILHPVGLVREALRQGTHNPDWTGCHCGCWCLAADVASGR